MKFRYVIFGILTILLLFILAGCSTPASPATPCPTAEACPECPDAPECPACPDCPEPPDPVVKVVPFEESWANSPHNDMEAEAFNHWNEEDPPEVPTACAACHSTTGYIDFAGGDGSEAGVVDQAVPATGETVQCIACHNTAAIAMTSVAFPSGVVVEGLKDEARCMVCHQGRASKIQVDEAIEKFGVSEDVDKVPEPVEEDTLGFINIHYYAAASTLYGTAVQGGYEYSGKSYDYKNAHVENFDTCIGCHRSHSLELKINDCTTCHEGVETVEDMRAIRMAGSLVDYDGDGDIEEGIAEEIDGLREMLASAMSAYSSEVVGDAIVYSSQAYPYFFIDTNGDGEAGEDEAVFPNAYQSWTARLLKAAYNYQVSTKDPGAYAHGGKYIIQLLYDSIDDLNQAISEPVDLSQANRIDNGHFAGSEEAFRHWDADGEVPGDCAKCHSADGLPMFLKEGVNISTEPSNGLKCSTCHDDLNTYTRWIIESVKFPSGAVVSFGEGNDSNTCLNCHQGRESTVSVDAAIARAEVGDDEVSEALRFSNPHYFAAGATLFGTDVKGAYEYAGNEYRGQNEHVNNFATCTDCHDAHVLEVKAEACSACHGGAGSAEDLEMIRITTGDFDGDGDETEGIAGEIETMQEALLQALQDYTAAQGLPGIVWGSGYPYFFTDSNGNGEADADETVRDNSYATWTPRLLRGAYNYQWIAKDPGAYAHNGAYILQILYDSLSDLGADVSAATRPAAVQEQ